MAKRNSTKPPVKPGDEIPFSELDEYAFQKLCRDLLYSEPEIDNCEVYGERGEPQDGIDVIAERKGGEDIEVGQCKCYGHFYPKQIHDVGEEFFKHWNIWSKRSVKKFILFLACSVSSRQQLDAIEEQKRLFKERGIVYRVWSSATLQNKLRPRPDLVSTYFHPKEVWVPLICGVVLPSSSSESLEPRNASIFSHALAGTLDQLTAIVSGSAERELERMRAAWREGRKHETVAELRRFKQSDSSWFHLKPIAKAKILRFEAGVELEINTDRLAAIRRAKELIEEARHLAPDEDYTRIRAIITRFESGSEAALPLVAHRSDVESVNLRAGLLLDLGRVEDAALTLARESFDGEPNADTFRLRALVALLQRKPEAAAASLDEAFALDPKWEMLRYLLGIVQYFRALATPALPGQFWDWPRPPDWIFVKQDDKSISFLRSAAETFAALGKGDISDLERRNIAAWQLACLANDPDRQEEAVALCKFILEKDRADYRGLIWAIARRYAIEWPSSEKALHQRISSSDADILHVVTLLQRYSTSNREKRALNVLQRTKGLFVKSGFDELWLFWQGRISAVVGKGDKVVDYFINEEDKIDALYHRVVYLRAKAGASNDYTKLIEYLHACYADTDHISFLLELCDALLQNQQWSEAAELLHPLVVSIGTYQVLHMAVIAAFNAGEYADSVKLIEQNTDLFPHGKLPSILRRVRAYSSLRLGSLPEAIAEAEILAREEPERENLLTLIQMYADKGDLKSLAVFARALKDRSDLSVEDLLFLAKLVRFEDLDLARYFWRRTQQMAIPENLVGQIFDLGMRLGLEAETRSITTLMVDLSQRGQGGIKQLAVTDILEMMRRKEEQVIEVEKHYTEGVLPIHAASEIVRAPLALPFLRLFGSEGVEAKLDNIRPLFVRHGGRSLQAGFSDQAPEWRLHMDITSLLMAADLNILEQVEQAFAPIHVPPMLPQALVAMRDDLSDQQPVRTASIEAVLLLVRENKIHVFTPEVTINVEDDEILRHQGAEWTSMLAQAQVGGGVIVDSLPLHKRLPEVGMLDLPGELVPFVVNCRSVVDVLYSSSIISEQEYTEFLDGLGTEGREATSTLPKLYSKLYLEGVSAELLALTGVLHKVVEFFEVLLAPSAHLRFSRESAERLRRNRVMEWLAGLTEKVRRGLDNNTYRFIAASHRFGPEVVDEDEGWPPGFALNSILTLLSYVIQPGDVIWVDDRYTNGFFRRDTAPIVGVNEVLKAMVATGAISKSRYFDVVIKMREADFRFIPVEGDEILYHLAKTVVDSDGVLIETRSLKVLRQYVARCLRDVKLLQWPPKFNPNSTAGGETAFVLELSRAAEEALITVWETEDDKALRLVRADWLLNFLCFDPWLVHLLKDTLPESEEDQLLLAAAGLASLISQGQSLGRTSRSRGKDLRNEYREWLERNVLNAQFDAEPRLVEKVSEILKSTTLSVYQNTFSEVSEEEWPLYIAALGLWIDEYPELIQRSLERDVDFMKKMGRKIIQVVSLGKLKFSQEEFWPAAEKVIDGQRSKARLLETDKAVNFIPSTTPDAAFFIMESDGSEQYPITEVTLTLLSSSSTTREQVLRNARDWFDCPDAVREQRIVAIVDMPEPRARVERAAYWRDRSVSMQYAALVEHLAERQLLQLDMLLQLDIDALLEHYRFNPDCFELQSFSASIAEASSVLLREEGVYEAIRRLSRFPVPLPQNVFDALDRMQREEQRVLVRKLLTIIESPLGVIHVTRILVYLGENIPSCMRLARRLVRFAFKSELRVVFDAYFVLLRWVFAAFSHRHAGVKWHAQKSLALSWAHTDELFRIFVGANMSMEWLRSAMPRFHRRITHEIFDRDLSVWFDIAHPHRLHRTTLLATGFAYSLGSDLGVRLAEQLQAIFLEESFHKVGDDRIPTLALLSDPYLASNVLNSFLGEARYEQLALLLGADAAGQFSHEVLLNAVRVRLAEIREGRAQGMDWLLLQMIVGDLPPEDSIRAEFVETLYSTDYVRLFENEPEVGLIALRAAIPHVVTAGDVRLSEHISASIAGIARCISKNIISEAQQESGDFMRDCAHLLLEGSIYLAMAAKQKQEALEVFYDVVSRIVDAWRASAELYLPAIQRFCRELPPGRAKPLWRLLIRLRAE